MEEGQSGAELIAPFPILTAQDVAPFTGAVLQAPLPVLVASGGPLTPQGAVLVAPAPVLLARSGAQAVLAAPSPALTASGTQAVVGRATLSAPMPALTASGTVEQIGRAVLTAAAPALVARGGTSGAVLAAPAGVLSAKAQTGSTGIAILQGPCGGLVASGGPASWGRAVLMAPMLEPVASGRAVLMAPAPALRASGGPPLTQEFAAYAINLKTSLEFGGNELTCYENFPFSRVVKAHGRYWAVGPDGLYQLGGTRDGDEAVQWSLATALMDFGDDRRKNLVSAYVTGRLSKGCSFEVQAGEGKQARYRYDSTSDGLAHNYRQRFGRGAYERFYALGIEGKGLAEISEIQFELAVSSQRKV